MKRILLASAVILGTTGVASAMTHPGELTNVEKFEVRHYVPNADLTNLTTAQANAISAILSSGSDNERGGEIRAILN